MRSKYLSVFDRSKQNAENSLTKLKLTLVTTNDPAEFSNHLKYIESNISCISKDETFLYHIFEVYHIFLTFKDQLS